MFSELIKIPLNNLYVIKGKISYKNKEFSFSTASLVYIKNIDKIKFLETILFTEFNDLLLYNETNNKIININEENQLPFRGVIMFTIHTINPVFLKLYNPDGFYIHMMIDTGYQTVIRTLAGYELTFPFKKSVKIMLNEESSENTKFIIKDTINFEDIINFSNNFSNIGSNYLNSYFYQYEIYELD